MTPSTTISATPPAAPAPPPAPPAAPPALDASALQSQIDQLRQTVEDSNRAAEYWKGKATTAEPKAAPPAPKEEDDIDPLEAITQGAAGFDRLAEKRGFIKKADVAKMINSKAEALTTEQRLYKIYPDLEDKKSEFFAQTAAHYARLVKANVPEEVAMELAAEKTELAMLNSGKRKTPQALADDEKTRQKEEKKARANAQQPDRGSNREPSEEDSDELTPEQERIAVSMLAGNGVTREQAIERYKARAKAGVQMKGTRQ